MNTGTRNIEKAKATAQEWSNRSGLPYCIFFPAAGGNLHVESIPDWHKHRPIEWSKEQELKGNTVIFPEPAGKRDSSNN